MGTFSAPTQKTRVSRACRASITVYRPPVARGEEGMMRGPSLIESQHAPKAARLGTSYADIMATSPPNKPETVDTVLSQPVDISPAQTEESVASPETVLPDHLESLHLSSSAKPVVTLPPTTTATPPAVTTPPPFPQVPSE